LLHPLPEESNEFWYHFVSDEIVYGTECCDPSFKNSVASRDWLSEYKFEGLRFEINFVPVRKSNTNFSAVIQLSKPKVRKLLKVGMRDLAAHFGGSDGRHPMLIDGGKAIQYPKRVQLEGISSVIRLKGFDNSKSSRENVFDGITEPVSRVTTNRKGCGAPGAGRMQSRQTPRKLIQPGPERIDELSNQKRHLDGHPFALHANDVGKFLRIILTRDDVRFWVKDLAQFGLDFIEVASRPRGFQLQIS
jgi:hypothetical protein